MIYMKREKFLRSNGRETSPVHVFENELDKLRRDLRATVRASRSNWRKVEPRWPR